MFSLSLFGNMFKNTRRKRLNGAIRNNRQRFIELLAIGLGVPLVKLFKDL